MYHLTVEHRADRESDTGRAATRGNLVVPASAGFDMGGGNSRKSTIELPELHIDD